jgi:hypothetical protein
MGDNGLTNRKNRYRNLSVGLYFSFTEVVESLDNCYEVRNIAYIAYIAVNETL